MRQLLIGILLVLVVSLSGLVSAFADFQRSSPEQQAAGKLPRRNADGKTGLAAYSTVITTQNWQQYKDYMPGWMQVLFSGQYAYKLGPSQQIVVGPTIPKTLPKAYLANTEKYNNQVRLQELPEGATLVQNYTYRAPIS